MLPSNPVHPHKNLRWWRWGCRNPVRSHFPTRKFTTIDIIYNTLCINIGQGVVMTHLQKEFKMSVDLAYAAGLIDGEGTITLMRKRVRERRSPMVSVSSTTLELLEFMKYTFGGHIIALRKTKHKQAWHWQVSHDVAISVIEQVYQYLREPEKKRRAQLIITEYKNVTPRNGKYTPELNVAREMFEAEFFLHSKKVMF